MKQEILQSALQIAEQEGWDKVSTRRITQEFGYTTSAIYYYLGGKKELLTELQKQGFALLQAQTQAAADQHPASAEAQLKAISWAFWEFAHAHRSLYELMFGLAPVACEGADGEAVRQAGAVVQVVLARLAPAADTSSLFLNWWAMVSGFMGISFTCLTGVEHALPTAYGDAIDRFIRSC